MSLAEVWPWWVEEEKFMGIIQLQGPLVNRRAGTGSTGKISLLSTVLGVYFILKIGIYLKSNG